MFDTVNIGCDLSWTGTDVSTVLDTHTDWGCSVSGDGEIKHYKRQDKNLQVYLHPKGYLNIYGSWSKYIAGNNFYAPTLVELKKVAYDLSHKYAVNLLTAKVNRADVAHTLQMDNPAIEYYSGLGSYDGNMKRVEVADGTLEYRGNNKILCIYDKVRESVEKGTKIPEELVDDNSLRIESRWTTNASISKMLGFNFDKTNWTTKQKEDAKPKLTTILREDIYQTRIFPAFKQMYMSIKKGTNFRVPTRESLTFSEGKDTLLIYFLANLSEDDAWRFFDNAKFNSSNQKTEMKKYITGLIDSARQRNDLNQELDAKVEAIVPYYA
jgi:hypothetical protein